MVIPEFIPENIKKDFPYFNNLSQGKTPSIYLDNAATTHKPQEVIDTLTHFYTHENASVHRSIYHASELITSRYESARITIAQFIGAHPSEVAFTSGTTASINMVARGWGETMLKAGDEIIVSGLEHHANLVPWQEVAKKTGARLHIIPVYADGTLDYQTYATLLNKHTRLVAITHSSNVVGTQPDIQAIVAGARTVGARVMLDAAQSAPHQAIDVQALGIDFLAFSAHKLYGPTGVGLVYLKKDIHHEMQPLFFGGGMVHAVESLQSSWLKAPHCYEAGTPAIAPVIAFAQAITYIQKNIDFNALQRYEASLTKYALDGLQSIKGVRILGPVNELKQSGHLISFVVDNMHPHDTAAFLDFKGIAVRAGNHCAQPLHKALGIDSSVRASFAAYTTPHDVQSLVEAVDEMVKYS